jgi:hypothetical protein
MNPGYEIAMIGGFADKIFADKVAQWARRCVSDAYVRTAQWSGAKSLIHNYPL